MSSQLPRIHPDGQLPAVQCSLTLGCSLSSQSVLPHRPCLCLMAAVLPAGSCLTLLLALCSWGDEAAAESPQVLLQLRGLSSRDLPEQNRSVNPWQPLPPLIAQFLYLHPSFPSHQFLVLPYPLPAPSLYSYHFFFF